MYLYIYKYKHYRVIMYFKGPFVKVTIYNIYALLTKIISYVKDKSLIKYTLYTKNPLLIKCISYTILIFKFNDINNKLWIQLILLLKIINNGFLFQ